MTNSYQGSGEVSAPAPATAELAPDASFVVTILSAKPENDGLTKTVVDSQGQKTEVPADSEHIMVACQYPDGFVKNHQVQLDYSDLSEKIQNTLKGRFGVGNLAVKAAPDSIVENATFTFGSN